MKPVFVAGITGVFLSSLSVTTLADPLSIFVTASRTAETVDETLVPVSQITRADIERTGVATVADALSTVPGVIVTRNGGVGQNTSVFLRGTESDHVMVMINGVKVGSASLGTTPFQDIPISQVEKIEVVRGPRSSLYGSEAIGGVIHIFTRRGGDGLKPNFSISGVRIPRRSRSAKLRATARTAARSSTAHSWVVNRLARCSRFRSCSSSSSIMKSS